MSIFESEQVNKFVTWALGALLVATFSVAATTLSGLSSKIDGLSTKVDGISSRVTVLEAMDIKSRLSFLERDLTEVRLSIAGKARVDTLAKELEELKIQVARDLGRTQKP